MSTMKLISWHMSCSSLITPSHHAPFLSAPQCPLYCQLGNVLIKQSPKHICLHCASPPAYALYKYLALFCHQQLSELHPERCIDCIIGAVPYLSSPFTLLTVPISCLENTWLRMKSAILHYSEPNYACSRQLCYWRVFILCQKKRKKNPICRCI